MLLSQICWFQKESIYNLCFAVETCMDHRPGFFSFYYWLSGFAASITLLWKRSCHATLSLAFEWRCGLNHSIQRDRLILLDVSQVYSAPSSTFITMQCLFKIPNALMGLLHLSATGGRCATICDEKCRISQSPPRKKFLGSSANIQLDKHRWQRVRADFFFFSCCRLNVADLQAGIYAEWPGVVDPEWDKSSMESGARRRQRWIDELTKRRL